MIPYTYLLGWPDQNKWYYGVRYAHDCDPKELWLSYKTSSKYVREHAAVYGNPAIIEIRRTFKTPSLARIWEHKVLRRMKVVMSEKFLNMTDNKSIAPLKGDDNPAKRPEVRKLISENTPKKFGLSNPMKNLETAVKVSDKLKGRKNYWQIGDNNPAKRPEVRKKLSKPGKNNPFFNHSHTEEFKKNVSIRFSGIPKEKITCNHCGKEGGKNTMSRWHFDNCKEKIAGKD